MKQHAGVWEGKECVYVCHTHICTRTFFYLCQRKKRISYREMSFLYYSNVCTVLQVVCRSYRVFFLLSGDGNQGSWELKCFVVFYLSVVIFKLSFLVIKKKLYVFFPLFPKLIEQQILGK